MGRVIKQENEFLFPPTLTLHPCPYIPWDLGQSKSRNVTRKRGFEDEKRTRAVGRFQGLGWAKNEAPTKYFVLCCAVLSRFGHVSLFATLWTIAHHAPLFTGFSRQEYWSGLPCSSPGHLPNPGIEPRSPALQADSLPFELPRKPFRNAYQHTNNSWITNYPSVSLKHAS